MSVSYVPAQFVTTRLAAAGTAACGVGEADVPSAAKRAARGLAKQTPGLLQGDRGAGT